MAKKDNNIIIKRLVRSYLSSVISISLVLFLIGTILFLWLNTKSVSDFFRENAVVSVILKEDATEAKAIDLKSIIENKEFVRSAEYISREQGMEEMSRLLGSDFLEVFEVNPIPISIDVHIKGEWFNQDSLSAIRNNLSAYPLVREVTYQESIIEILNANLGRLGMIIAVVIALLLFISIVLIGNTVRMNIYARRFTIHTMQMVGAKRSFIRRPFLLQAALQGAVAALIADAALYFALRYADRKIGNIFSIFDSQYNLYIYAIVFAVGILICIFATAFTVNRLAYMSKDDMYY
ncbi:MAG: FtsX-like permease family protein [Bacteroidales bacterium]|nr:FtsX-like permease family protein [Bacteroidales bacterium]